MSKTIAIITGASSGIGKEFALQIDAHLRKTDEIWLIARDKKRLKRLSEKLRNNCKILSMDLTKESQIERLADMLRDEQCKIRMLVNCAGFGKIGDVRELSKEEQKSMVRLNCEALMNVTLTCLPYMVRKSRIIQMASSAAFVPQPGFAVYAATKAYVDSFSLALKEELRGREIYVTSVCPGPVDTPFFDIAEEKGKKLAIKELCMTDPYRVVDHALRDAVIFKKSRSVCTLPIYGFYLVTRIIPDTILVPFIGMYKEAGKRWN